MFKNKYQKGIVSVLSSTGSAPFAIWSVNVKNGHIKRITDKDIKSLAFEIMGVNVATTFITAPKNPKESLGIKLPFLVIIAKNMKKYFTFEITIVDDNNMRRRFKASNFQSSTKVLPFSTCMPISLSDGWNQIQFNLADFTRRAYGTQYVETSRIQINANVRIRRVYFSSKLYSEEELPRELRLFAPPGEKKKMERINKDEKQGAGEGEAQVPPAPPTTPPAEPA